MKELKKAHRILSLKTTEAYKRYMFCLKIKNQNHQNDEVIHAKGVWVGLKIAKERIKEMIK